MINVNELNPKGYSYFGKGYISRRNDETYILRKGKNYYGSYRTYELAYYVRSEMIKVDWDKKELPRILEEYPVYYTDLLEFYRYVTINKSSNYQWCISIPSRFSDNGITQQIRCSHLEDALFERDFLLANNWDYELLVYNINDNDNPYYDVELPPYPQRTIRNVSFQKTHTHEFEIINKLLMVDMNITEHKICEVLGVSTMTVANWMKSYGTDWISYKKILAKGINPLSVLKLKRHIYKPDLTLKGNKKKKTNYIKYEKKRSRKTPYVILKDSVYYGQYPTREFAEKVVQDLIKLDWDKKELKNIWDKYDYAPFKKKQYIYENVNGSFTVRKQIKDKLMSFGTYTDYDVACNVRDAFIDCNWDTSDVQSVCDRVMEEYNSQWEL